MSVPRIPFQNLESNRNTVHCPKRKFSIRSDKKNSTMDGNENMDAKEIKASTKSNPIKAPPSKDSLTKAPPSKDSLTKAPPSKDSLTKAPPSKNNTILPAKKKTRPFIVYKDAPLETKEEILKQLPEPRIRKRGYAKYRNSLSLVEDEHHNDLHVFLDNDTPIRKLPYDCLLKVFGYFQHINTLLALSRVCHSWRKVVLQPILWKTISCNLNNFNRQLLLQRRYKQFEFVEHLHIITQKNNTPLHQSIHIRSISALKHLHTLQLSNVHMCDIEYITHWMTHIKSLKCTGIPVDKHGSVSIPNFSQLNQLTSLQLQFDKPCSLKLTYFFASPTLNRLPISLNELKLIGLQDREGNEITHQDIIDTASFLTSRVQQWDNGLTPDQILSNWTRLEEQLVLKYSMLSYLTNLTSLTLHSTNSFTSRVWRECLIPCSSNLLYLSIGGWSGSRENPSMIVNRIHAYRQRRRADLKISDVDRALSEFIASLTKIQSMSFHHFVCTDGIVIGVKALDKKYDIQGWPKFPIDHFLDESLSDLNITIKQQDEA